MWGRLGGRAHAREGAHMCAVGGGRARGRARARRADQRLAWGGGLAARSRARRAPPRRWPGAGRAPGAGKGWGSRCRSARARGWSEGRRPRKVWWWCRSRRNIVTRPGINRGQRLGSALVVPQVRRVLSLCFALKKFGL